MNTYSQVDTIGRGTFGVTLLVQEKNGNCDLRALKQINTTRLTPEARDSLHSEIAVLQRLTHPNVIQYLGAVLDGHMLCIVTEYAEGGDLGTLIQEKKDQSDSFADSNAIAIFAECVSALGYIHGKGILHRGLKCSNVLLTRNGRAKLGDFTFAKLLELSAGKAATLLGTAGHLAPEVCEGAPYSAAADIWSAGVVLYTMLALHPPFHSFNPSALIAKIVSAEPWPLQQDRGEDARNLVKLTLQKRPQCRPAAEELAAVPALTGCKRSTVITADNASTKLKTSRPDSCEAPAPLDMLLEEPAAKASIPEEAPCSDAVDKLLCTADIASPSRRELWSLRDAPPIQPSMNRGYSSPTFTGLTPQAVRLQRSAKKDAHMEEPVAGGRPTTGSKDLLFTRGSALALAGGKLAAGSQGGTEGQGKDSPRGCRTQAEHGAILMKAADGPRGLPVTPLGTKRPNYKDDTRDRNLDQLMDDLRQRERKLCEPNFL